MMLKSLMVLISKITLVINNSYSVLKKGEKLNVKEIKYNFCSVYDDCFGGV